MSVTLKFESAMSLTYAFPNFAGFICRLNAFGLLKTDFFANSDICIAAFFRMHMSSDQIYPGLITACLMNKQHQKNRAAALIA